MLDRIVPETAARFGAKVAYRSADGVEVSFAELDRWSDQAAVGLIERGVGEGDVVALLLPSRVEYLVAYFAAAKVGAITAGINPRLTGAERAAALGVSAPKLIIATSELIGDVGDTGSAIVEIIDIGAHRGHLGPLGAADSSPAELQPNPDRPAVICFTSGSTGMPKGALFTNRQLMAIADLDTGGAWGGGGHRIAPTEFAHVGLMTKMPWLLASGGTTHLLDKWRAEPILQLVHDHRMPALTGVAPQIALMLRVADLDRFDFDCVQAIVVGGSASPPALVREAREAFGAPYSIRYSSTECGGVGLGTALDADDDEALHTVGSPRPGVDAAIRDEDGRPLDDGEVGELWLRSEAVMSEYYRDPDATAATLTDDGWLRTGDLARIDERGLFRLSGRTKEMYIRGGYNVYPAEVEAVLLDHPALAEVAIVGREDAVMGEVGEAVIVVTAGAAVPDLDELRAFAETRLARFKLPERLSIVDALPRNGTDKIDRKRL